MNDTRCTIFVEAAAERLQSIMGPNICVESENQIRRQVFFFVVRHYVSTTQDYPAVAHIEIDSAKVRGWTVDKAVREGRKWADAATVTLTRYYNPPKPLPKPTFWQRVNAWLNKWAFSYS